MTVGGGRSGGRPSPGWRWGAASSETPAGGDLNAWRRTTMWPPCGVVRRMEEGATYRRSSASSRCNGGGCHAAFLAVAWSGPLWAARAATMGLNPARRRRALRRGAAGACTGLSLARSALSSAARLRLVSATGPVSEAEDRTQLIPPRGCACVCVRVASTLTRPVSRGWGAVGEPPPWWTGRLRLGRADWQETDLRPGRETRHAHRRRGRRSGWNGLAARGRHGRQRGVSTRRVHRGGLTAGPLLLAGGG